MKSNKLIFGVVLIAVGCSGPKQQPKTLWSELAKNTVERRELTRGLANTQPTCLRDTFNVTTLKAEMKELEKKFTSGTKVTGQWQHLDLSTLPIPQANFLKSFGKNIGDLNDPKAFDFSGCKDVPCIINKVYGKEDYVAGYVHYLWYLKFGNYLTAVNAVYDAKSQTKPGMYNGKTFPVSAYLYREKELFAWWRLSLMIKSPYVELNQLKEIYRVPQGESFDFVVAERKKIEEENVILRAQGKKEKPIPWGETCGLAYSNGYVIMQDLCLSLYGDNESGSFYDSVLHELTHQLDYHEGRKIKKTYRSQEQDYLQVASIYLKEYKDESGKTVRQWDHRPGIKLVTSYAGTSPAENFAETIAHYRVNGTNTKKSIASDHWNWVSEKYYPKTYFDQQSLIDAWLKEHSSTLSQLAFRAVADCAQSTRPVASTYFVKTDFTIPLAPTTLNCLGLKGIEMSKELQGKIKISSPDGCSTLSDFHVKSFWEPAFKNQAKIALDKYLKELDADKAYFERIKEFHRQLPDKTMANSAYLECHGEADEKSCYERSVLEFALEKVAPLNLPEANAQELAELYLSTHAFSDIKTGLLSYYRSFVLSNREITAKVAEESFEACAALPVDDQASPSGKYFTLADGYLVSSIYNCINAQFPETVKSVVRDLSVNGIKVQHAKEEAILSDEVVPELQKSLTDIYVKKRNSEAKSAQEFVTADAGSLRREMISDFSWVKDVLNSDGIVRDCQALAMKKIKFEARYHLSKDLFSRLVQEACFEIGATPEYNRWLEESKSQFTNTSVEGLENKILELARARAKECIVQYPIDTNLSRIKFKKERENCLIGEWESIEKSAIKTFESDPMVIRFKVDIKAVTSQLETNRRRHQLRIIKENF